MKDKFIIPEGTKDIVLQECAIKNKLQKNIENVLEKCGFNEIKTPTMEYYQTFNRGFQNLKEEDVFKFSDSKGKILVLRPDMTIPIARVVGSKLKNNEGVSRIRYCSDVFRVHEKFGGRRNEYTDCGVELIGLNDEESDIEILSTALETLKVLKNKTYKLEIGNINFFNTLVKDLNITDEDKDNLADLVDRKSAKELEDYLERLDIPQNNKKFLIELPWLFGGSEVIQRAKELAFSEELDNNIFYMEKLHYALTEIGYADNISFDLGMSPRQDYYTGIIFRGYAEGAGAIVLSGGRYDNLLKKFDKDSPAIGFSINLDAMIEALDESYLEEVKKFKIYYPKKYELIVIKKANILRNEGKIVELVPDNQIDDINVEKEVIYR